jgi:hypothetical protein
MATELEMLPRARLRSGPRLGHVRLALLIRRWGLVAGETEILDEQHIVTLLIVDQFVDEFFAIRMPRPPGRKPFSSRTATLLNNSSSEVLVAA